MITSQNKGSQRFRMRSGLILVIFPSLQLIQSLVALHVAPYFWQFYADPPYMYLFNSLSLATGLTPQHVDHPGTSMQWLMAGIEHLTFLLSGTETSLAADLVYAPEKYLNATGIVLAVLFASSFAYFLWCLIRAAGQGPALVAGLLLFSASGLMVPWVVTATPESLVASCSLVILGILLPSLLDRTSQPATLKCVALGALFATGLTAKVIMVPLAILLVFTLRPRALILFAGVTVTVSLLILLPVQSLFPRMFGWFINLARTSGRYGGESPTTVTDNLAFGIRIVTENLILVWPVLLFSIVVLVVMAASSGIKKNLDRMWPIMGLLLTVLSVIAVSFKQTTDRDFILLVGLVSTLGAIVTKWLVDVMGGHPHGVAGTSFGLALAGIAALVAVGIWQNLRSFADLVEIRERTEQEALLLANASAREGLVAHAFLAQNEFFALMLGSEWAHHPYSDLILKRFPENAYYNSFLSTVFGTTGVSSVGYLGCSDLEPHIVADGLTFVLPGDFSRPDPEATLQGIQLADGSILSFDTDRIELFGPRLSAIPIEKCTPSSGL